MSFNLNISMITKLGWLEHSRYRREIPTFGPSNRRVIPFNNDNLVRFFFIEKNSYICYLIKEFNKEEKKKYSGYKLITINYSDENLKMNNGRPSSEIEFISKNSDIMSLIIKKKAFNDEYKRHFLIRDVIK